MDGARHRGARQARRHELRWRVEATGAVARRGNAPAARPSAPSRPAWPPGLAVAAQREESGASKGAARLRARPRAPGRSLRYVTPRSRPDVSGSSRWLYTICGAAPAPAEAQGLGERGACLPIPSRPSPKPATRSPARLLRQRQRPRQALADDLVRAGVSRQQRGDGRGGARAPVRDAAPRSDAAARLELVLHRVVVNEGVGLQPAHGHGADAGGGRGDTPQARRACRPPRQRQQPPCEPHGEPGNTPHLHRQEEGGRMAAGLFVSDYFLS